MPGASKFDLQVLSGDGNYLALASLITNESCLSAIANGLWRRLALPLLADQPTV
jgi:hypothetical protein